MIIADIKDRERYFALHEKMELLWEYVLSHDLAHAPAGRIAIDGERVFINVDDSEMQPAEERPLEVHRRYIDVQIPLTASETVGGKPLAALTTAATEPFDAARDIAFSRQRAQAYLPVHPGQFYKKKKKNGFANINR